MRFNICYSSAACPLAKICAEQFFPLRSVGILMAQGSHFMKEVSKLSTKNNIKVRYLVFTAVFRQFRWCLCILKFQFPLCRALSNSTFPIFRLSCAPFAFGPLYGVLVCLLKNLLHLFASQTAGVGELANFIMGAIFAFTAGTIYKYHKTRGGAVISSVSAAFAMGILRRSLQQFPDLSALLQAWSCQGGNSRNV